MVCYIIQCFIEEIFASSEELPKKKTQGIDFSLGQFRKYWGNTVDANFDRNQKFGVTICASNFAFDIRKLSTFE